MAYDYRGKADLNIILVVSNTKIAGNHIFSRDN